MRKKSKWVALVAVILILCLPVSMVAGNNKDKDKPLPHNYGEKAYTHVKYLSEEVGRRAAGSEAEAGAAEYVKMQFEEIGLKTEVQPFSYTRGGNHS